MTNEEHSAVGGIIPLKGAIEDKEYNRIRGIFQCNLNLISGEIK
jgi:hypothetical protein